MIKKLKPKSEFSRNALTLITGATIAQAIPIAMSPILTRIYTPEDFGIFALYMAIASIISVIATGRYELAIILPKKDEDAINIVALSLIISVFISLVSFLIIFIFNFQITSLLGKPEISNWLYFIPVTVLLTGVYQSLNYWSNRKKQYKRLALNKVLQSSSTASANFGMGFGGFGSSGLIVGGVFGQVVATSILAKMIWKEDKNRYGELRKMKMIALSLKYIKLPKYNLPNALIDGVRLSGISILIAKFFTTSILGQFSLAWKMVQMPMGIIGGSLSQVFFQKISNAKRTDLYRIAIQFIIKAFLIAAPIFLLIYFLAADVFKFVFGENWELSGQAVSTMVPWLLINFVTSPLVFVMLVLNKQAEILIFSILYATVPLILIIVFHECGFLYVLEMITYAMSIMLLLFSTLIMYEAKKESV